MLLVACCCCAEREIRRGWCAEASVLMACVHASGCSVLYAACQSLPSPLLCLANSARLPKVRLPRCSHTSRACLSPQRSASLHRCYEQRNHAHPPMHSFAPVLLLASPSVCLDLFKKQYDFDHQAKFTSKNAENIVPWLHRTRCTQASTEQQLEQRHQMLIVACVFLLLFLAVVCARPPRPL